MSRPDVQATMGQREYAPGWAVVLAATLLAASFGRRRAEKAEQRPHEEAPHSIQLDDGYGQTADAPFEIPRKGWKDILLRVEAV